MKEIKGFATYIINHKIIILISDEYNGNPLLSYEPDIILCSQYILNKFNNELFGYIHKLSGKTQIKVIE